MSLSITSVFKLRFSSSCLTLYDKVVFPTPDKSVNWIEIMNFSDEQLKEFLESIKRDDFATQINTKFRVNGNIEAELVEVSEAKIYPRQESFSMLFLFPSDFPPFQGQFQFEHPELGTHEIFVVPIENASDGIVFQAVFNRMLPKN